MNADDCANDIQFQNLRKVRGYSFEDSITIAPGKLPQAKVKIKYTVNGLRLQANIASAVLTQIEQECTCSVPKVYMNGFYVEVLNKETKKETKTLGEI